MFILEIIIYEPINADSCDKGGLAIFVHNSPCFSNADVIKHREQQEIVLCSLTFIWYFKHVY
jgi:hypothetical protein